MQTIQNGENKIDIIMQKNNKGHCTSLSCKLTSTEFREHKATILSQLKEKIISTKLLGNGIALCFPGNDDMLDKLIAFIKAERICCDFFTFNILVGNNKKDIWLELTGPDGVKEFIKTELGFDTEKQKL